MSAAWRLAINSLSERRSRSALLVGAVALSAALIVCVACAMSSAHEAINKQVVATVGTADIVVQPAGSGRTLRPELLDQVRAWPEAAGVLGRLQDTLALSVRRSGLEPTSAGGFVRRERALVSTAVVNSAAATADASLLPQLLVGRHASGAGEIVIDAMLAHRLSYGYHTRADRQDGFVPLPIALDKALLRGEPLPVPGATLSASEAERINASLGVRVGDEVQVVPQLQVGAGALAVPNVFRKPETLVVVGIAAQPPIGGRAQGYMTLEGLQRVTGQQGLSQIDVVVNEGVPPEAAAAAHRAEMPAGVIVQTTQKITSGLDKNMASSQLGMVLATVMAFLSAAFIITTGLTTNVAERQRELAILRCIGGERRHLAQTQLLIGAVLGVLGAVLGVPAGILLAWLITRALSEQLPTGFVLSWLGVALGVLGSIGSGLIGAAWPAWRTARISPLAALASRAALPRAGNVLLITGIGVAFLIFQMIVIGVPDDGQIAFWGYATAGLPLMAVGYFLLGVPLVVIVSKALSPLVSAVLRLPPRVLGRSIAATPYRYGLTAGALMAGLALMVAIWTNGGAMLRDWFNKIEFPDAFVSGLNLPEAAQARLDSMDDIVAQTAAVTLHPVETDIFGIRALQRYKTTFVGFDPGPFFDMANLTWVQGDPATALRRLDEGGAVIVAREFLIAKGMGVGSMLTTRDADREHTFEIVGVVSSPGLEVASKFFNVGEDYLDQAVHAIFGSRRDMKQKFFEGQEAPIHLIQIEFAVGVSREDDAAALEAIRRELLPYGILDAGSGRQIKEQITFFARGGLLAMTTIAFVAMLVACFGVANLIIASVQARQFEFGVLRAVGAQRGLLSRLVVGEALLVAVTACILGTLMGVQGSWAGQRLYRLLLGLDLELRPPPVPILIGCLIVTALTLMAAWPAIWRLNRKHPRDLLSGMRG